MKSSFARCTISMFRLFEDSVAVFFSFSDNTLQLSLFERSDPRYVPDHKVL